MKKIIVIGGGAAGMMSAITSSENGGSVTLIEKNSKLGRKIYITGKGRCNVTNNTDVDTILDNTMGNPSFLYSALYNFDSSSVMDFFENNGVSLKTERGNRVFPVSDKSTDIIDCLARKLKKLNVNIKFDTEVTDIIVDGDKAIGVKTSNKEKLYADKIIVATGGLSYQSTGSTGDGYKFAKDLGHKVTKLHPSLVPLITDEDDIMALQGLSLKNIKIKTTVDSKNVYEDFGEIMFTHYGISGPLILKASRYLVGEYSKEIKVFVDLKPALNHKELDDRILRDFQEFVNKAFKNSLDKLLPQKIIPLIIKKSGIDENKKVNEITKEERKKLVDTIKSFSINIVGNTGYRDAVITVGGVNVKEIDPSTMESKLVKGLFFAGEVIDIDSFTGGFNLQLAFSTGKLAGEEW